MSTHPSKGFTLVELVLYIGIFGSIALVLSLSLNTSLDTRIKNQAIFEVESQGASSLSTILRTVRDADGTLFRVSGGVLEMQAIDEEYVPLTNTRVVVTDFAIEHPLSPNAPESARVTLTLSAKNEGGRQAYNYEQTFFGSATPRP
jgi:type II secretory pathway pseudopilin PulG